MVEILVTAPHERNRLAIRWSLREALRVYCILRQADLSIHRAMGSQADWDDLRSYFVGSRLDRLSQVSDELLSLAQAWDPSWSIEAALSPPIPLILWRRSVNWLRSSWTFSASEVGYMAAAMNDFRRTLAEPAQPTGDQMIALRMRLAWAGGLIQVRLVGRPELLRADRIEHFGQAPHRECYTLEELMASLALADELVRRGGAT